MHKAIKNTTEIWRYMETLALHTSEQSVHLEEKNSCIYVVEVKRVTPRVKHIDIFICFLQEQFENGIFVTKYEKYSIIL